MTTGRKWVIGVSGSVASGFIGFALVMWFGHFAQAGQNTRSIEETQEIQGQLVEIVDKLSNIHEAKDAGKEKMAELCRAGKLTDCSDCAEAGIFLDKCSE